MDYKMEVDDRAVVNGMNRLGRLDASKLEVRHAKEFARTLKPITRVDTGSLRDSVGSRGNEAGYGIKSEQIPQKLRAPWNAERLRWARRLIGDRIRKINDTVIERLMRTGRQ